MSDRPKGTVIYDSTLTSNPLAIAATAHQKQLEAERRAAAEKRAAKPVPNRVCYAQLYEEWKARVAAGGSRKLPKCKRCDGIIRWEENHQCEGFKPKFVEHDQEWHERQDARREEIRKTKHHRETPTCKWCAIELPEWEDYDAHMSEGCPEMP